APEMRTSAASMPSAEVPDIIPNTSIGEMSLEAEPGHLQPRINRAFTQRQDIGLCSGALQCAIRIKPERPNRLDAYKNATPFL
ncbi:MAG TPA: hypothetical protein VJ228_12065, partial [Candidatus Acidoferrales bacterium]|nr:hypothetical protein [Candidatus Acidoferrales bacterium]